MRLGTFSDRLDDILETDAYADIDGSPNGLQVGDAASSVDHAAFAVDAASATIDDAVEAGADVLVTHHGLWWEGTERLIGPTYERVRRLIESDVGLYVSHLPLDGHPTYGNAAGVAERLSLVETEAFGAYHGETIGRKGHYREPRAFEAIVADLSETLDTGDGDVRALSFGADRVESVAIVTGDGTDWLGEAIDADADVFVTGEGAQRVYHDAREHGINVVLAGHYGTETFGIRSLARLVEEWGLSTTFVSHPTGL